MPNPLRSLSGCRLPGVGSPDSRYRVFLHGEASLANGWVKVQDSGLVSDPALPQHGAFWFRKEIELSAEQVRVPQYLFVGFKSADFFRVYLNGKLVEEEDMEDYTHSSGLNSRIYLMPEDMREGVKPVGRACLCSLPADSSRVGTVTQWKGLRWRLDGQGGIRPAGCAEGAEETRVAAADVHRWRSHLQRHDLTLWLRMPFVA